MSDNMYQKSPDRLQKEWNIGFDAILFFVLGIISIEINVPYALDQLDFHHAMTCFRGLERLFVPYGTSNPLVLFGNLFVPLKLLIRVLTVGMLGIYLGAGLCRTRRLQAGILMACIMLNVLFPQYLLIQARIGADNHALAHDGGTIQMEESMKMILQGRNPYVETFEGTPLENWRGFKNNIIYHVPYMPGAFLFSIPFYKALTTAFGWYDQRIFYMFCFICAIIFLWKTFSSWEPKATAIAFFALNPMFAKYYILGSNDVFPLSLLIAALWGLRKRRLTWAFLFLGAACAVKQFAWFFLPFFILYGLGGTLRTLPSRLTGSKRMWLPGFLLMCAVIAPFALWHPRSFFRDTYSYVAGGLPTSYPMQGFHGYGFATILLFLRLVPDGNAMFPFHLIQLPLMAIVLPLFLIRLEKRNVLSDAVFYPAFLLFIYMFFSRYFHGNFLGFVLFWFVCAWCLVLDEREHES